MTFRILCWSAESNRDLMIFSHPPWPPWLLQHFSARYSWRGKPKGFSGSKNLTFSIWWARQDLSLRPLLCRRSALTTELLARRDSLGPRLGSEPVQFVGEEGLEPSRPCGHIPLKDASFPVSPLALRLIYFFHQFFLWFCLISSFNKLLSLQSRFFTFGSSQIIKFCSSHFSPFQDFNFFNSW